MPERLVLCGGAKWTGGDTVLRLALDGRAQNITLKLEDISRRLVRDVPDLLIDLVEIATYIYCADQATSRGGDAQVGMGSAWRLARSCMKSVLHGIEQILVAERLGQELDRARLHGLARSSECRHGR